MDLRDSPYFDRIRFNVNSGAVTIEMNGSGNGVAGLLGMNKRSVLSGISPASIGDHRRYNEYEQMCQKIEQIVEDGKRGGQNVGINTPAAMLEQIRNAPDMETVMTLCTNVAMLTANAPDRELWKQKIASAMADAQMRLSSAAVNVTPAEHAQTAVSTPVAPKLCSACGAKYEGGKFCQYCGTPF